MTGPNIPAARRVDIQTFLRTTYGRVHGLNKDSETTKIVSHIIQQALKYEDKRSQLMTQATQLFLGIIDEQIYRRDPSDWLHKLFKYLTTHPREFLELLKPGNYFWSQKPVRGILCVRIYSQDYLCITGKIKSEITEVIKTKN